MLRRHLRGQPGFSVVELLIALSVFFLVLGGIFQIFGPSNVMYLAGQRKLDVQQSARVAMDTIVRQVRMAGYFPENYDANPANDLASPVPIQVATDTTLAVYGDTDGSGASNVFLFCLDASGLRIGRGPNGAAASYQCANGQVLADNITSLRFAYYDTDNVPLPDPPAAPFQLDGQAGEATPDFVALPPNQRGAVRTVVITLTSQQNVPGQAAQVYTLSSDVRLRNLN